jgi:hypothetical protein
MLRDNGITLLLNRKVSNGEEFRQLVDDVRRWQRMVENILEKAGFPLSIAAFRMVDVDVATPDGWNHEHRLLRGIIGERANRLDAIIEQLKKVQTEASGT